MEELYFTLYWQLGDGIRVYKVVKIEFSGLDSWNISEAKYTEFISYQQVLKLHKNLHMVCVFLPCYQ